MVKPFKNYIERFAVLKTYELNFELRTGYKQPSEWWGGYCIVARQEVD